MKKLFSDFKAFIAKGNVLNLAVGIVIGAAFTAITTSFVADIINPLLSLVLNKVDMSELAIKLNDSVSLTYGNLLQKILDFLVISFTIFMMLRIISNMQNKAEKNMQKIREAREKLEKKMNLTKKESKMVAEAEAKEAAESARLAKLAEEEAAAQAVKEAVIPPTKTELLLEQIRDLLKSNAELTEKLNAAQGGTEE